MPDTREIYKGKALISKDMQFNFRIPKTNQLYLRKKVKIPNKPSKELARVFGDLLGDGHLQVGHGLVSFYSKNLNEIWIEQERFSKLFGIRGKIYKKKNKKSDYRLFFCSKTLAQFFHHIKMPNGNKTDQEFLIPYWIMNGSGKIKGNFLSGFYDAEGCIYPSREKGKTRWRICINQHKREMLRKSGLKLMNQLVLLHNNLNITTGPVRVQKARKRKDGTKIVKLFFEIKKESIREFGKSINFENPLKKQKLLKAINNNNYRKG